MENEEIIIQITVTSEEANKKIKDLQNSITGVKQAQADLDAEFVQGKKDITEYTKATNENNKQIKQNETAIKNVNKAIESQANSINSLNAKNRELKAQRNALLDTDANYFEKVKKINEQIDLNDTKIKSLSSSLEKQRLNIGNYSSALQGIGGNLNQIVPGFSGFTNGIQGATAGAKAFIATPFGAALQIINTLLDALIGYFKGSEEGQRKLNVIVQTGSAIFEKFMDVVEGVGEAIYNAFTNPKQALLDLVNFIKDNLINRFKAFSVIIEGIQNLDFKQVANGALQLGSGVENVIGKVQNLASNVKNAVNQGIEQGTKLAALQEDIRKRENKYQVDSAKVDAAVALLREKAITQEGNARRKTLEEAIALEKNLGNQSLQIAEKKLELAKLELETKGNDQEAIKAVAQAEANLAQVRGQGAQATIRFQKELESLRSNELKAEEDLQKAITKAVEEGLKARSDAYKKEQEDRLEDEKKAADFRKEIFKAGLAIGEQARKNAEEEANQRKINFEKEKAITNAKYN